MNLETNPTSSTTATASSPPGIPPLSATQSAQLEAWLQQFHPAQPPEALSERLRLALELSPEPSLSTEQQTALEAWLREFYPAKPPLELSDTLAEKLNKPKHPVPSVLLHRNAFWQASAAAAALAVLAWTGSKLFLNTQEASTQTPNLVNTQAKPAAPTPQADPTAAALENFELASSQAPLTSTEDLLFPAGSSSTRAPFAFLPEKTRFQRASSAEQEPLRWPQAAFSGRPTSSEGWQELQILQPHFQLEPAPSSTSMATQKSELKAENSPSKE